jgi:hypothetical protein
MVPRIAQMLALEMVLTTYSSWYGTLTAPYRMLASGDVKLVALLSIVTVLRSVPDSQQKYYFFLVGREKARRAGEAPNREAINRRWDGRLRDGMGQKGLGRRPRRVLLTRRSRWQVASEWEKAKEAHTGNPRPFDMEI